MHYIVGTQIVTTAVRQQPLRPGMSSAQIKSRSTGLSTFSKQREQLSPGVTYTLIRVYTSAEHQDKVCYAFTGEGSRVELVFDSIKDAEKFISQLRNEQLPDYEEANRNKTD